MRLPPELRTFAGPRGALLGLAVLLAAFVRLAVFWNYVPPDDSGVAAGFWEAAVESGIDFRMQFLPAEQGENFKVNFYDHGCGVALGDYNGDGLDDVYLLNQLGSNGLYRNQGDGSFENVTHRAGNVAFAGRICVGATFSDYDNDGDQDLFVTTTRGGNALLQNDGRGGFNDVTRAAGLAYVGHSQTAAFFDADADGDLDLLVTNTAQWTTDSYNARLGYYRGTAHLFEALTGAEKFETNRFYRNNGDGTFSDATDEAGLHGEGWGGDVAVFDSDDDGDADVFIADMFGRSHLYRNDGAGHFQDATAETLGRTSFGAIGSSVLDFNSDGRLDLFVADMHSDMWLDFDPRLCRRAMIEAQKKYPYLVGKFAEIDPEQAEQVELGSAEMMDIDYDRVVFGNTLFQNRGDGKYDEVSERAGAETFWPWGVAPGDFDNDGHEDVFIPAGMGYPYFYYPSSLLMNDGRGAFTDLAAVAGIEPPLRGYYLEQEIGDRMAARSSRCAATADFDGDGRLDLIVNNFNDGPYYFRNRFPERGHIAFKLVGTRSNRDAIGAVVKLHVGGQVMVRQVRCAGGYLSQSSKTLHFGLGERSRVERVEIRWPSGTLQTILDPTINQLHWIEEPSQAIAEFSAFSKQSDG